MGAGCHPRSEGPADWGVGSPKADAPSATPDAGRSLACVAASSVKDAKGMLAGPSLGTLLDAPLLLLLPSSVGDASKKAQPPGLVSLVMMLAVFGPVLRRLVTAFRW